MSSDDVNKGRRRFLVATTSVVGGIGVGIAAVPFIKSWMPSARAQAVGGPVEVNLGKLKEGQLLKVQWRGQTIGVLRRTTDMVAGLSKVDDCCQIRNRKRRATGICSGRTACVEARVPGGQHALHPPGLCAPDDSPGRPSAI